MRPGVVLAALLLAGPWAGPLAGPRSGLLPAQSPQLEVKLPAPDRLTREGPTIRALNVISDRPTRDMIEHGFPARLRFRAELWSSGGWFNSMLGSAEWNMIVSYDALKKQYRLERYENNRLLSQFQLRTFEAAVAAVERAVRAPIRARPHADRQYYLVALEVETMSANDLDELRRWLRGELRPAVRGERNPGTALGRGLRQLFANLLGAERRNLQERSATFRVRD
ncbi:MAG TPA: DUF4390 domain-containing protein [Gemmatimonadaceae bacterium]|nr:DUF4390 domain-containing protein [Gemmatimonadaceae bacterium]